MKPGFFGSHFAVLGACAAFFGAHFLSPACVAQENGGAFPFVIPWDDASKTPLDVSFLNDAPAGKNGRLIARGEHFVESGTGRRVKLMGVVWNVWRQFSDQSGSRCGYGAARQIRRQRGSATLFRFARPVERLDLEVAGRH